MSEIYRASSRCAGNIHLQSVAFDFSVIFKVNESGAHGPVTRLVTFGREERQLVKDQFVWTGVQMAVRHSVVFGAHPRD